MYGWKDYPLLCKGVVLTYWYPAKVREPLVQGLLWGWLVGGVGGNDTCRIMFLLPKEKKGFRDLFGSGGGCTNLGFEVPSATTAR